MVQGFGKEIQPRVIFLKTEVWFSVKQNCERKIQWRIYNPGQKHWGSILKWTHFLPPPPDFNVATFWSIFSFAYDTASIISHGGMKQHWWRGERGRRGEEGERGRREREGGACDIPSFVFCTVSRESFATLSQSLLARIVDESAGSARPKFRPTELHILVVIPEGYIIHFEFRNYWRLPKKI